MKIYQSIIPVPLLVSLDEPITPIEPLDEKVWVKLEYLMPTGSFKDRGACVVISEALHLGVQEVYQDSSGNAGIAVASYARQAGITCTIFVPEHTSQAKIDTIRETGAALRIIPGSRDHCAEVCRREVGQKGVYYASHVYRNSFLDGTKTMLYEILQQWGRLPETLFIPVGNGTMFLGVQRALDELQQTCRLVLVQSEHCAPLYDGIHHTHHPLGDTLAEGIAVGEPMRLEQMAEVVRANRYDVVIAPEHRILEAKERLAEKGYLVEDTTAATYAAYLEHGSSYGEVLIPLCGKLRKK